MPFNGHRWRSAACIVQAPEAQAQAHALKAASFGSMIINNDGHIRVPLHPASGL
ncbi:hypothetical protein OSJ57_14860 [Sphingomonas sp. HH69]